MTENRSHWLIWQLKIALNSNLYNSNLCPNQPNPSVRRAISIFSVPCSSSKRGCRVRIFGARRFISLISRGRESSLHFPWKATARKTRAGASRGGRGYAERSEMEKDVPFSDGGKRAARRMALFPPPLPSAPRRAGVPRFYVAASARGSHSLARRRGGTSGAVTVGHVFAHSALRRCPSPFPFRVVRCKHAAGVRQVAANARTTRIRNNLTSRRVRWRVIVTVYDISVVAFVTRPSSERSKEREQSALLYTVLLYWTARTAHSDLPC